MAKLMLGIGLALFAAALLWGESLQAQVAGAAIGPETAPVPSVNQGELLIGELNCVACHQANAATRTRLFSRESPRLGEGGWRLTPQYLRAFLSNPAAEKPGTTMPNLLHSLAGAHRAETVDALVHFLCSLYKTNAPTPLRANGIVISEGGRLYHRVGCVACHAPRQAAQSLVSGERAAGESSGVSTARFDKGAFEMSSVPLGNLGKKTTIADLAGFLMDPLKAHPSGRMPSLNLKEDEARKIAMYLLREQPVATSLTRTKGLDYQDFAGNFSNTIQLDAAKSETSATTEQFSLNPTGTRIEYIGLRFNGLVSIAAAGNYTFYTSSDDGSRLYVDDRLVVDNDGHHATTEKSGTIELTPGEHPIRVSYFNNDGAAALRVLYQGPGLPKQEIPAKALSHMAKCNIPTEEENLVINPEKAIRGKELFASLGCAACHQLGKNSTIASTLQLKPLASLDPSAADNCLNATPQRAPKYQLSDSQRVAIRSALATSGGTFAQPLPPPEQVTRAMAALNCFACHSRDGLGGPARGRVDYFTVVGGADLGDEGRFPPHLTRVGEKLRPEWLREVLLNKGTARPYMATRMPQFGEAAVGQLATVLGKVRGSAVGDEVTSLNSAKIDPRLVTSSPTDINYGRKLVGTEGLSCIACHVFAGHESLGVPAMDLTVMTRRLQKDWFDRYLLDPPSLRPGTRMPSFWPEGKSTRQDLLDGDCNRQIDAIWTYLSRSKESGLPTGLIHGKMELVATNEAIIYRNFIQGAGSRGIGVGYPEKANLAFDANELRLALIWQGPFIDAARHRSGRGEGFEGPLGYNVVKMPTGAPFAILEEAGTKWPEAAGKKAGYQMRGYQLDAKRRPTFLYSFEHVRIEDYPVAVSGEVEASLRRTLTLQAEQPLEKLWFRAWSGTTIETQRNGSFLADGKIKLEFQLTGSAKPMIRQSAGKTELLVPVMFDGGKAKIVEEVVW